MTTRAEEPKSLVAAVLQELDALRKRMEHVYECSRGGETAITAAALAEEVKSLCQQASLSSDHREVESLLVTSRRRLDDLQKLLGVH